MSYPASVIFSDIARLLVPDRAIHDRLIRVLPRQQADAIQSRRPLTFRMRGSTRLVLASFACGGGNGG
ncbi:MAG: hypothetical protein P3W94_004940 [Paracoccus sp. (in: a-proteobacteria)]|nr:hypothetical protein [Paracoccus sp. (in: a-proteobacteria)]